MIIGLFVALIVFFAIADIGPDLVELFKTLFSSSE